MTEKEEVPEELQTWTATAEPVGGEMDMKPLPEQMPKIIPVPRIHPEKFKISGFVFSRRFRKVSGLPPVKIPETDEDWEKLMVYQELAAQIEKDSLGGPTVNSNSIQILIDSQHPRAGSDAEYIWMRFGHQRRLRLNGLSQTHFPSGWWLTWDLQPSSDFLENVRTNDWDDIYLENPTGDGILIRHVTIVHSGVTILDWACNEWIDGSPEEKYGALCLTAPILQHKLAQVEHTWVAPIHWAARELGKTDSRKYGSDEAWCSEFASWCLAKALWYVPDAAEKSDGCWGSLQMEEWFDAHDRKFGVADVTNRSYILTAGDYLRGWNGQHSALFVKYLDGDPVLGPDIPTLNTSIRVISGNSSQTVRIDDCVVSDITSIGSTR